MAKIKILAPGEHTPVDEAADLAHLPALYIRLTTGRSIRMILDDKNLDRLEEAVGPLLAERRGRKLGESIGQAFRSAAEQIEEALRR